MMWEDHRQDCEPRDENLHSWTYVVKDVQQWNNLSESRCCACHSHVCVCLSSLLSQGEADSRPRQWNSHDQPEGVTALPGKHDSVWNILTSSNTSLHSLEGFFYMFVTQHVLMCRTPPRMNDEWHNLNSLFPGPLSSVLCMRGFACFSSCNPSLIPVVSSSCPDILRFFFLFFLPCSWGRCDWWSHAGHWHAPTCSALMPHYTSRWTRRNPPGSVLSVTRRPRMNTSL